MSFFLPKHSLSSYAALLLRGIRLGDWWRRAGVHAVRSLPVFPCHLCMSARRSVWGILNYFCEGLSLSPWTKHPVGWLRRCFESPASVLLWLALRYRREGERVREKKRERVRQPYSLSTLTHSEAKSERPGRKENASTPLTPLTPAPHSTLKQLNHPLSNQELLIFHCGLNHTLLTLGVLVFSVFGGYVLTGACPEDPWLPGADSLAPLQVQDADSEGQTRHYAADCQRGGRPFGRHGWTQWWGAAQRCGNRCRRCRQAASSTPLCRHGEWQSLFLTHISSRLTHLHTAWPSACLAHVWVCLHVDPFLSRALALKVEFK